VNEPSLPEDLDGVDKLLQQIRFLPRSSLEPELLGRVVRGEEPALQRRGVRVRRYWAVVVPAGLTIAIGLLFLRPEHRVTIDRCCYDLDGGGPADDGAVIIAERNGRVHRLSVYEDRDGSGTFTTADAVRLQRAGSPMREGALPAGLIRIRHCCQDLDGGGPPDDGIMVVATPPDRVHTAAIYELR
jgi:hypothetical protein